LSVERGNAIFEFLTPFNGLYLLVEAEDWGSAYTCMLTVESKYEVLLKYYPPLEKFRDELKRIKGYIEDKNKGKALELIESVWKELMMLLKFEV